MALADTFARPRFLRRRVADPAKPSAPFVLTASVAEVRAVLVWRGARDALAVAQGLIHLRELEDVIALEFFGIHVGHAQFRLQLLGRLFVVEH